MSGIGEATNFIIALNPFYHLDKIFFDGPPVGSIKADGEAIRARGLVWLKSPNGFLNFIFINVLGKLCINIYTDF